MKEKGSFCIAILVFILCLMAYGYEEKLGVFNEESEDNKHAEEIY